MNHGFLGFTIVQYNLGGLLNSAEIFSFIEKFPITVSLLSQNLFDLVEIVIGYYSNKQGIKWSNKDWGDIKKFTQYFEVLICSLII